jgi:hypothetical protein
LPADAKPGLLNDRIAELRHALAGFDPAALARRTGSRLKIEDQETALFLSLWDHAIRISFPGCIAREVESGCELSIPDQALLLYYFITCDSETAAGRWIAFSELPNGRFYTQAFQGYTGFKIVQAFGSDLEAFCGAAESLGGLRTSHGDAAYRFQALPNVPLLTVYWLGDEDFPPSCQILFDAAVSHHLPTDACAILGSSLVQKLIRRKAEQSVYL